MRLKLVRDQEADTKKKTGIDFNQLIAKTHRLNSQLIGLQITTGNLIALCLSAGQISGGVVALLWAKASYYALLSPLLCFPLAIVIERLSLGGLMIVRTVNKELMKVEDAYQKRVMKLRNKGLEASEAEKYDYKQRRKRLKGSRGLAIPIILLGIVISGAVGDQIWQVVFGSLAGWLGLALSLCCALTISLTFIFSELFKDMADEGLVDIIQEERIDLAVLAHAERGMQIDIAMQAFVNVQSDPLKSAKEVGKVERVLGSRISAFAEYVEERGLGSMSGMQEIGGGREMHQIEARSSSKRRYEDTREDLHWYLQRYPAATNSMVAAKFSISRSTAKSWLDRMSEDAVHASELAESDPDVSVEEPLVLEGEAEVALVEELDIVESETIVESD